MNAFMEIKNPDSIEVSLTLTMKLKDWKELREQLPEKWPAWDIGSAITDMVRQAEVRFYPKGQE